MPALLGFDLETFLIADGDLAPKPVVASFHDGGAGWIERFLNPFDDDCAEETIEGALVPGINLAVANGAYDAAVTARRMPSLLKLWFEKYKRGEVFETQIAATLDAIAEGRLTDGAALDRNYQPLRVDGETGKITTRFSLNNCVWLYLGRRNAKENDEYRLRYGELSLLPTSQWPQTAKVYPVDDAGNTLAVATVQKKTCQNIGRIGEQFNAAPLVDMTHLQLHTWAHFCMHMGAVYGFRTDGERIAAIEKKINATFDQDNERFLAWGFMRQEQAHHSTLTGNEPPCAICKGAKQVPSKKTGRLIKCGDCAGSGRTLPMVLKENGAAIRREVILAYGGDPSVPCTHCQGKGRVPSPVSDSKVNCKPCGATGIHVPRSVPRTPADGIATDRDTLDGTGNSKLEAWAEAGKNDKMRETYLPWLKKGIHTRINTRPNAVLATGRCSYDGLIQLIPPAARECIVADDGMCFVSCDYPSLELCTLAQATFWTVGYSRMRDVINATKDPGALHSEFGARMGGIDPADKEALKEFLKLAKDKKTKPAKLRQMAKAGNFGFPGMMGVPKFVLTKRKEGLRFCEVSGINETCTKTVMQWRDKDLDKPTCPDCLEVADDLRKAWFEAWPEIKPYFNWVTSLEETSRGLKIVTPGTGFVRDGMTASAAANHTFQHLGAYAAKLALCHASYEAYCDPASPLFGSRLVVLAHDELFFQVPMAKRGAAGKRICEIMRAALKVFCPDIDVPEPEPAYCKYWYKKAALLRHKDGTLVLAEDGQPALWEPVDDDGNPVPWAP